MKQYISEERAIYEDMYHGQFSKKLAEWAISKMKKKDFETGKMKPIGKKPLEEVQKMLKQYGAELPDSAKYTEHRAYFVYETICDPDGCPANVLDCFVTKMCNAGEPIYWEDVI